VGEVSAESAAAAAFPTRDDEAVAHFVEQAAAALADHGMQRMPARVLMQLMATEEQGLTAADLAKTLRVSPAAISSAVRMLAQLGLVERFAVAGQRRDRYRLPDDAWYTASIAKHPLYRRFADLATDGVLAAGGTATAAGARLAEMHDFFEYCDRAVPGLVEAWHAERLRSRGGSA
jgi:hypothetical protein